MVFAYLVTKVAKICQVLVVALLIHDWKYFTISEVAADWPQPMSRMQHIMRPFVAGASWAHDAPSRHTTAPISHIRHSLGSPWHVLFRWQ